MHETFYVVESDKSFAEVVFDLEPIVQRLGFVVLHSYDLGEILRRKGIELDNDCHVFDVCNYRFAEKVLAADILLGLTVPWRIAVFTDNGATRIGLVRPQAITASQDRGTACVTTLAEIENKLILIVDEVR